MITDSRLKSKNGAGEVRSNAIHLLERTLQLALVVPSLSSVVSRADGLERIIQDNWKAAVISRSWTQGDIAHATSSYAVWLSTAIPAQETGSGPPLLNPCLSAEQAFSMSIQTQRPFLQQCQQSFCPRW